MKIKLSIILLFSFYIFIGQEMDEQSIKADLDKCLSTDIEISNESWKKASHDSWPVARTKNVD